MPLGVMAVLLAPGVAAAERPVVFQSTDGTPLAGMLYEASNRPAPAVVLVHMLQRSKDDWRAIGERLEDAGITALAIDLRGHGQSGGSAGELAPLVNDVRAAITWLAARPGTRPGAVAVVGASLGANLAAAAAADSPMVRAIAVISPSLDYRGVRIDAATMRKIGDRPMWLAASTDDPYALRTVRELAGSAGTREQSLSPMRGHGTALLQNDRDLARALVDWLKRSLIS